MTPKIPETPSLEPSPRWNSPQAVKLPEPTIWPVTLAVGITCLVWGLVTSLIITGVGFVLFAFALNGWIQEIRHERNKS